MTDNQKLRVTLISERDQSGAGLSVLDVAAILEWARDDQRREIVLAEGS